MIPAAKITMTGLDSLNHLYFKLQELERILLAARKPSGKA